MSAREREVLDGLLGGGTNKTIARELGPEAACPPLASDLQARRGHSGGRSSSHRRRMADLTFRSPPDVKPLHTCSPALDPQPAKHQAGHWRQLKAETNELMSQQPLTRLPLQPGSGAQS